MKEDEINLITKCPPTVNFTLWGKKEEDTIPVYQCVDVSFLSDGTTAWVEVEDPEDKINARPKISVAISMIDGELETITRINDVEVYRMKYSSCIEGPLP